MLQKISNFWLRHIHPRLAPLIATIGIVGLASCLLILFVLAKLAEEVLERDAFAFDTTFLLWLHQFANPNLDNLMQALWYFMVLLLMNWQLTILILPKLFTV